MKIGILAYDVPAAELLELALAAEPLGFEGIWLGEHVLAPLGYESLHPTDGDAGGTRYHAPIVGPDAVLVDPLITLAAIGASTEHLGLGTGIYVLPLRHPLVIARAGCTLHEVSGGRFRLGVGSGWLEEEFAALGVPFAERQSRFNETIAILRKAWAGGPFEHAGKHYSFESVQICAETVSVPIVFGGNTEFALRRAVTKGDAWVSSGTPSFDDAMRIRDRIAELRSEHDRDGGFRTFFRLESADPQLVERYRAEGIDDVILWADHLWPAGDRADRPARLADLARQLRPQGR